MHHHGSSGTVSFGVTHSGSVSSSRFSIESFILHTPRITHRDDMLRCRRCDASFVVDALERIAAYPGSLPTPRFFDKVAIAFRPPLSPRSSISTIAAQSMGVSMVRCVSNNCWLEGSNPQRGG
ncbi:hypothetical protein G7Y89_g14067 [Cudoniella acicularis]|uniref:Uncharacterized protein n=1 Tax=Cudoniella acicularis TaxID=354080 RepID=A0A8H4R7C0_9HELO|nr:hypothetical protein G7Y89_g14067 [Cudoniella acicularis]